MSRWLQGGGRCRQSPPRRRRGPPCLKCWNWRGVLRQPKSKSPRPRTARASTADSGRGGQRGPRGTRPGMEGARSLKRAGGPAAGDGVSYSRSAVQVAKGLFEYPANLQVDHQPFSSSARSGGISACRRGGDGGLTGEGGRTPCGSGALPLPTLPETESPVRPRWTKRAVSPRWRGPSTGNGSPAQADRALGHGRHDLFCAFEVHDPSPVFDFRWCKTPAFLARRKPDGGSSGCIG
jgi:hypothetical protein